MSRPKKTQPATEITSLQYRRIRGQMMKGKVSAYYANLLLERIAYLERKLIAYEKTDTTP